MNNIIISGVPEKQGEKLEGILVELDRTISITMSPMDIISIFRAGQAVPEKKQTKSYNCQADQPEGKKRHL